MDCFCKKRWRHIWKRKHALQSGTGQSEVIGHFKDVHQSQGRCREHLKATPPSTLLPKSIQSNRSHVLESHCVLKNIQWSISYTDCMTLIEKTLNSYPLNYHLPNIIRPKILYPIPSLAKTWDSWVLISDPCSSRICGHFIFWTRKPGCHRPSPKHPKAQ